MTTYQTPESYVPVVEGSGGGGLIAFWLVVVGVGWTGRSLMCQSRFLVNNPPSPPANSGRLTMGSLALTRGWGPDGRLPTRDHATHHPTAPAASHWVDLRRLLITG